MKTSTKIIIAIIIILLIGAIGALLTLKTIIGVTTQEKEKITSEEFYSKMQEKGYIVVDVTEQYAEYNYIEKVYIATPSDYSYKIEFYELTDNNNSLQFYNNNKSLLENSKNGSEMDINAKNSNKYVTKSNGKYSTISRIDNTNIYVNEKTEYEEQIKQILQELGY